MKRQALIAFVILNIAVSILVALLVIRFLGEPEREVIIIQTVPVPLIITTTPQPSAIAQVGAPGAGADAVSAGTAVPGTALGNAADAPPPDSDVLPEVATAAFMTQQAFQATGPTGSASGTYTVEDGDNPSIIAEKLGVSLEDLLCINNLGTVNDPDIIYPGQELLVPGEDFVCASLGSVTGGDDDAESTVTAADGEPLATVNQDLFATNTPPPTVTLAPTAANAQVTIVQVFGAGDVTSEGVEIRNQGGLVDLQGWTLADTEGNVFAFPDFRLFPNSGVTVFSGVGVDTPMALFWGETRPVWQLGDVISLTDDSGVVQSTLRVGGENAPPLLTATPES